MNDRIKPVVVGYDGSAPAVAAVEWAAIEARRRGAPLTVLHVADYLAVIPGMLPGHASPMEESAMRITAEGVERARKAADGLDVRSETHVARPVPALVEASRDAALLVVGSHGHGEMTAALLGSVAYAATAHAHCPVVVVRSEVAGSAGPTRPVTVGVDAWPGSQPAVEFAAEFAAQASAPLVVLAAYRAAYTESGAPTLYWALEIEGAVQFERVARQQALDASEAAAAAVRRWHPGLEVLPKVVEGPPARVLVDEAQGGGLLVVGARGDGGFAGLRLGSITHAVLHDATCPVAVVRDVEA